MVNCGTCGAELGHINSVCDTCLPGFYSARPLPSPKPKPHPAMIALVLASKLQLPESTSGHFDCPRCSHMFTAYRSPSGKLSGSCSNCGLTVPRF